MSWVTTMSPGLQALDDREVRGVPAARHLDGVDAGPPRVACEVLRRVGDQHDRHAARARGGDGVTGDGAGVGVDEERRHGVAPGSPR